MSHRFAPVCLDIIDAHQHFWDLTHLRYPWLTDEPITFRYGDYSSLKQNFLPVDYRQESHGFRVIGTVHVEAEVDRAASLAETRWLAELHCSHYLPSVIVAHAELDAIGIDELLGLHAQTPLLRGIRQKPRVSTTMSMRKRGLSGSMDDMRWRDGYALLEKYQLSFDLQAPWWELDAAWELAEDFPHIQIILDHCGLPSDRSMDALAAWRRSLELLAQAPNAAIKASGLGVPGVSWLQSGNGCLVADIVRIFGSERVLFGSNYPVDRLVGSFAEIVHGTLSALDGFDDTVASKVMSTNAARIYRIDTHLLKRQTEAIW